MSRPFLPCCVCEFIQSRDAKHLVREVESVIVEDEKGQSFGIGLCREHATDYRRAKRAAPLAVEIALAGGLQ